MVCRTDVYMETQVTCALKRGMAAFPQVIYLLVV